MSHIQTLIKRTFGNVCRKIRKKKNFSQNDLAKISGLHINTICLLENGKSEIKITTFFFLAKGLSETPDSILCDVCNELFS